ncbi:hypothetical protein [Citrobacter portucalensis]|uniref:hypothetical protein n=1 Tax=Citrobacter portucalensis TaxID=1639133 RepID=UPI003B239369
MNENINQQPERAVFENEEQINNIIFDVFKNTGQRITKDDPILSLFFLNSELQKQQSKLLESNFISLSEGFRHILTSLEQENLQRFKEVIASCGNVEKEIQETVEKGKHELDEHKKSVSQVVNDSLFELVSSFKRSHEKATEAHQKHLIELTSAYKKNIDGVKPFSKMAAIAICAACTLFVTAGLSGAFWYVNNQSKAQMEENMNFAASGFFAMQDLTKKVITQLPPAQQAKFKKELDSINKRTK